MTKLTGPEYIPSQPVKHAVIFLHGLGSNGQDLIGLAPFMSPHLPDTAFFAPNAPLAMNFTADGYQWFEYWDRTPLQIMADIQQAVPLLIDYVSDICARFDLETENIVLCGFSQGTMMSLHVGLRHIENLGGIVGFSGMLLSPETLGSEQLPELPPVLLVHGMQDPVVPFLASQQAEAALMFLGGDVALVERPNLQHSIDEVGISSAVEFCRKIFAIA